MKKLIASSEPGLQSWFTFTVPDSILRTMNKAEYKEAMSWLRLCRRKINEAITPEFLNKCLIPPEIKWFQLNAGHSYKA